MTPYQETHNLVDSNHILYIHPSDLSLQALTTIKLNGDNYATWKRAVEVTLLTRNKLELVTGEYQEPSEPALLSLWKRCNGMVCTWLSQSVEPFIAKSIVHCKTAREAWLTLETSYGKGNRQRIFHLKQLLGNLKQGNDSVSTYYTHFKSLWDELDSLRTYTPTRERILEIEEEKLLQFLMGLNEVYTPLRGQLLRVEPAIDISKAYNSILEEEQRREISAPIPITQDSSALLSRHHPNNHYNDICSVQDKQDFETASSDGHDKRIKCNPNIPTITRAMPESKNTKERFEVQNSSKFNVQLLDFANQVLAGSGLKLPLTHLTSHNRESLGRESLSYHENVGVTTDWRQNEWSQKPDKVFNFFPLTRLPSPQKRRTSRASTSSNSASASPINSDCEAKKSIDLTLKL